MADQNVRGRFVWHELMTPNPEGAHDFYGAVLGWKKQPWEQDPSYLLFTAPGGPLGAAYEKRDGSPQWVPYIGTDDVAGTVEAAQRLGARVETPPTPLPNGGKYALLADPQGGLFGVHEAAQPMPQMPQSEAFSWHELASTTDPLEAFRLYSELFGWEEMSRTDMGAMGIYLIFGRNGARLGGIFNRGQMGRPGPAYWLCYVSVQDLDGSIEKVKAARGSVLMGPMEVPGGDRIAQLADPHGALFALHWPAEAAAAAPAAKAAHAPPRERVEPASGRASGKKKAAKAKSSKAPAKKKSAKKGKKTTAKKAAKKAAKKPARKKAAKAGKTSRKTGKKPARKAGKKAARKAGKKTARKTGAKAARRKKASRKAGTKVTRKKRRR
ncbi:MAG TPA: VOC family protein [Gammaproteobacteria bacterium]